MASVHSRQFCPTTIFDSFQSSISKFHDASPLRLFRYSPSITSHKPCSYVASCSTTEQNPSKKSGVSPAYKRHGSSFNRKLKNFALDTGSKTIDDGNSGWLDDWDRNQKRNQPKQPQLVVNYRKSREFSNFGLSSSYDNNKSGGSGGGNSTMEKIVEKLKKFGYMEDDSNRDSEPKRAIEKGSVEDIFYVEEGMLPNTRGGFSKDSPLGVENVFGSNEKVRFPWEKNMDIEKSEEGERKWTARRESRCSLAEMTLPELELRRLRNLTFQIKNKTKIGAGGVTQAVVDKIHEKWKTSEVVRLKIEGAAALNMRRMHEILERKTGGLVIWRSGTSVSLYRGVTYEVPSVDLKKRNFKRNESAPVLSATIVGENIRDVHTPNPNTEALLEEKEKPESAPEAEYEDEIDNLLDSIGPRYTDWSGCEPSPVDADLLPGLVPGYEPPFRVLPYGVRSTLGQKEATALRRLSRVLSPHFAIGRSRQLQGLAAAMIKLWEKSSIAKVALKRGVQLTTSERMAEQLKKLTGGILLSRNKDFLVFYRGKDFLSPEVAEALLQKERLAKSLQDEEEKARLRASALVVTNMGVTEEAPAAGTLEETLDATAKWGKTLDENHAKDVKIEAEKLRHANLVRKLERKLAFAERKLLKGERALSKVEQSLKPAEHRADPETITDEERYMFRKLGLRMKAYLLLGRRGVFDGTVENMHLHWKYRELVKILVKVKTFEQVQKVALALEAESGGVLVSVDKVSKGYAIIVYRGKDYKRPSTLRPKNLLTKRKALARSIELQRREALMKHVSVLQTRVAKLKSEIEQMDRIKDEGDKAFYDKLDTDYPTSDEDNTEEDEGDEAFLESYVSESDEFVSAIEEDEGDEAYLETCSENDEDKSESSESVQGPHMGTTFSSYESETESGDSGVLVSHLNGTLAVEDLSS